MDKKYYDNKSKNHLKEPSSRRNYITGKNIKKQHQRARSSERIRKR